MPPPHINKTSGSHVTAGETLVLTCSVSVNWNIMVSLSWSLPNQHAAAPRLLLPDPVSRNVSIGGSYLKVEILFIVCSVPNQLKLKFTCCIIPFTAKCTSKIKLLFHSKELLRM